MLAALLAVFLQALVVQTHVDGLSGFGRVEIQRGGHSQSDGPALKAANSKADIACPICQVAATAGRTLLASAPTIAARPPVQYTAPLAPALILVVRPSHAWQSRAPPQAS